MPRSRRARSGNGSSSAAGRARKVRVLLMDVDGVLTDGRVYLQSFPGDIALELKAFHSQDGAGLKLARIAGLRTGIITGRESAATTRRAQENGMEFVYQGRDEKVVPHMKRFCGVHRLAMAKWRSSATICRICRCCVASASPWPWPMRCLK